MNSDISFQSVGVISKETKWFYFSTVFTKTKLPTEGIWPFGSTVQLTGDC